MGTGEGVPQRALPTGTGEGVQHALPTGTGVGVPQHDLTLRLDIGSL